jgi:hypothetical protein
MTCYRIAGIQGKAHYYIASNASLHAFSAGVVAQRLIFFFNTAAFCDK